MSYETDARPIDPPPPAPHGADVTADGFLTKDAFADLFIGTFNVASGVTRLETLAVEPGDEAAKAAAGAIYDTCMDVPSLQFIIRPDNVWMQRAMVVGAFAVGKGAAVRGELRARRQPKAKAAPSPDATDYHGPVAANNPVNDFPAL